LTKPRLSHILKVIKIYKGVMMTTKEVSVVEAKKHFSDLLGQVAYGRKRIRILKRGKPMAVMVPPDENQEGERLSKTAGWLESDDPFFEMLEQIVRERGDHVPRISKASKS
jgi:prevent-host-death family protein